MYYLNIFDRVNSVYWFLRTEFICIIWTFRKHYEVQDCSWGLNLFVLFELIWSILVSFRVLEDWIYLYYLNVNLSVITQNLVLEDWIYLYYLNLDQMTEDGTLVLEDWIYLYYLNNESCAWTYRKFLRTEFICIIWTCRSNSAVCLCSWGLNLFVLFEQQIQTENEELVLEDWIYLYYLNPARLD